MPRVRKPRPLTYDKQWEKWTSDIKRIETETVYVFERRMVFREIMRMFKENPELNAEGGFVWDWLSGIYGRDMVIAVGRELDRDVEVTNLIQLMYQMSKRPRVVSRKRYFKMLDLKGNRQEYLREMNERWFTENVGAGAFMDVSTVQRDRNWLERRCKAVMKYRHKMVAHRTSMELTLTIKQIHDAFDAIETMLKKYYALFTGAGLVSAEPAVQFYWSKVFTIPWKPPRSGTRRSGVATE